MFTTIGSRQKDSEIRTMPIYEYKCAECGHTLEAIQKFSDEPLKECPGCKKLALEKQLSASAFRLKGSGWYETDFKTGSKKNLAGNKADSSPAAKPGSGSEVKSKSESGAGSSKKGTESP